MSFIPHFKSLNNEAHQPASYLQIVSIIRSSIEQGQLLSGEKLPSSRVMAKRFSVGRQTLLNALNELIAQGWILSRQRVGYFVAEQHPVSQRHQLPSPAQSTTMKWHFNDRCDTLFTEPEQEYQYNFVAGTPDINSFPFAEFKRHFAQVMNYPLPSDFSYGNAAGQPQLLSSMAGYLRRSRNITARPLLISNGSQDAIYMVSRLLLGIGDRVAVDQLGYQPAWSAFKESGAELVKIASDEQGLDPDELAKEFATKRIRLIYLTPQYQYPTTVTLSTERRNKIYQLAVKYGVPILEDDYDHEYHYQGQPLPPIASEDPAQLVIYIGTLSKILYPGVRIGFISAPPPVHQALLKLRQTMSHKNESMLQRALALWMIDGGFERHLRRSSQLYKKRLAHTDSTLRQIQQSNINDKLKLEYQLPAGGLGLWLRINVDCKQLASIARTQGILIQDQSCFSDTKIMSSGYLRLGFARQSENCQQAGIEKLLLIASNL
ncbi:MAG: PLP-dependent aminotransferase family protein [Colwellia sp.]|nr:PLP-dependent aminotransferase family protein [Colwellia sp.]